MFNLQETGFSLEDCEVLDLEILLKIKERK